MSNFINIEVGITDGSIDIGKSSINFRNFRNLSSDGVITLDDTSIGMNVADIEHVQSLFQSLVNIYESEYHVSKLKLDSKLQDAEIVKE